MDDSDRLVDPIASEPLLPAGEEANDDVGVVEGEGGSSVLAASFTLANAAIGSGVLAFPYAYMKAGLGVSLGVTLSVAALLYYTVFLLVKTAHEYKNARNFEETVEVVLGPIASHVLKWTILLAVVGATTGYLVLIGDNATSMLQTWFGIHWYTDRRFVISAPAFFVALPLSLLQRIQYLAWSSVASILAVCYIVCVVIVESFLKDSWRNSVLNETRGWVNLSPEAFLCVPICCYALGCHTQSIAIYGSLKDRTMKKMHMVLMSTFAMALGLYIPMGTAGYVLFGENTERDVLVGFGVDPKSVPLQAQLGRIAIAIVGLTAFPIQMWPARSILKSYLLGCVKSEPSWYMPLQVICLWVLVLGLALSGLKIDTVFGIVGSTAAVGIVFVYPILMGWRTSLSKSWIHRVLMVVFMVVGIAIGTLGTVTTIMNAFKKDK